MSQKPKQASNPAAAATQAGANKPVEILKSLLAEDETEIDPWIAHFRGEEIYAGLNAIAKYAGWVMSKNCVAIDPAIERAMAHLCNPSGTSTPA
jgi:hypothetical protein